MKDKPLPTIDDLINEMKGKSLDEIIEEERNTPGPWLISRDELLAAGALYVPPSWRKSLRVEPDLFADLPEDAGPSPEES